MLNRPEISTLVAVGIRLIPIGPADTTRFYDALAEAQNESELPAFALNRLNEIRQALAEEDAQISASR